jgi:hypothetical protein
MPAIKSNGGSPIEWEMTAKEGITSVKLQRTRIRLGRSIKNVDWLFLRGSNARIRLILLEDRILAETVRLSRMVICAANIMAISQVA